MTTGGGFRATSTSDPKGVDRVLHILKEHLHSGPLSAEQLVNKYLPIKFAND